MARPHSAEAPIAAHLDLGPAARITCASSELREGFVNLMMNAVHAILSLGDKSGWEVAQAVRKMRSATEVILVTGWAAQLGVDNPSTRGVDRVLAKPFTLEQISTVLDRTRQRRIAAQRPATA